MVGILRALLAAVVLTSWAAPGQAITPEEKTRVRQLVKEGGELLQQGRHAEARDQLMAALALAPVPAIALYAGMAHENLHELVRAAQLYRLAIDMPLDESLWDNAKSKTAFQLRSREQARAALRQLLERSSTIRIQVVGSAEGRFQVTLDGIALGSGALAYDYPVPSGSHVVVIVQGSRRLSQTVSLDANAEHSTVTFDLAQGSGVAPAVPAPASVAVPPQRPKHEGRLARVTRNPERAPTSSGAVSSNEASPNDASPNAHTTMTWVAYGVGAMGLGVGVSAGLVTLGKRSNLVTEGCSSDGVCPRGRQIDASELDRYNTWRTITTVGFIVGGVGVATGVTLSLTRPKKSEVTSQLALYLAPGTVEARGTF